MKKKILIVGAGYAGLGCLKNLSRVLDHNKFALQIIDPGTFHQIKTRFHERLAYPSRDHLVREPLDKIVKLYRGQLFSDKAVAIDLERGFVQGLQNSYSYDILVLTIGATIAYMGIPGAAKYSFHTQNYAQIVKGCNKFFRLLSQSYRQKKIRLAVCGAGIEGLEVAAMLRQVLPPNRGQVLLVNRNPKLLPRTSLPDKLRNYAGRYCHRQGLDLHLGEAIKEITPAGICLETSFLSTDLTFWCGGVRPKPLPGVSDDRPLKVATSLQSPDYPNVFGLGDAATIINGGPDSNQASAQRAVFQGRLAAENIHRYLSGEELLQTAYKSKGELIALGDNDGVGLIKGFPLQGRKVSIIKKLNELRYRAMLYRI